ncbi:hypothetical protein RCG19_08935 [Neobacillus sp. OS1-2]|nr:hypothetical protein [Neobacillus sp. OS1-2]WML41755.1 hypothetical protein RCG19_08935 [Neobacillus sp. OS1-2]
MGCCNPEYRKAALEKEEQLNKNGKDSVPIVGKVVISIVTVGVIIVALCL